jgi:predicted ATPase
MKEELIREIAFEWDRIDQDSYLRSIPAFHDVSKVSFSHDVTFLVGENGSGKSTLLEAMAVASGFNLEGGSRNYSFSTYDSHSELYDALKIIKSMRHQNWGYFLRAESFYNVATKEMDYADALHPSMKYHEKSHGESFLQLMQNQFKPNSLYFLDEPEAALSPQRQLSLLVELKRCTDAGSQFFIVTHSPILLGYPDAEILTFDDGPIHPCHYEDTESYLITEMFINRKEAVISKLFQKE